MNAESLIELQNAIVKIIASAIAEKWDAVVVNIEIDLIDGEQTENCLALSFAKEEGVWKRGSFQLPFECYDLFVELRDSDISSERWKSCTLEFNSSGKYEFSYSYDSPRRLNGIHSEEALLKEYTPRQF